MIERGLQNVALNHLDKETKKEAKVEKEFSFVNLKKKFNERKQLEKNIQKQKIKKRNNLNRKRKKGKRHSN